MVERRPFLGGKAFSFTDPEVGVEVDNGQHVYLGCCTAYIALLRLLGTLGLTELQPLLDVPVRDRTGRTGALRAARLPPPAHLGPSFLAYPHLSAAEKASAGRALAALAATGARRRERLDEVSFADWLADHGQGEGAIARFWDLIVLPTCNDRSDLVSAGLAAFVFQEGFLRTRTGSAIGWSRVGLTRLVDPAARAFLEARGGRVLSGRAVAEAGPGRRAPGRRRAPPGRRGGAGPPTGPGARGGARGPARGPRPGVVAHPQRPPLVRPARHGGALRGGAGLARRSGSSTGPAWPACPGPGSTWPCPSAGPATRSLLSKPELVERYTRELAELMPAARAARVERAAVVKEPEATFAAAPGPGGAAAVRRHPARRRLPGRRVDGHGLAGDDGGRRPLGRPRGPDGGPPGRVRPRAHER